MSSSSSSSSSVVLSPKQVAVAAAVVGFTSCAVSVGTNFLWRRLVGSKEPQEDVREQRIVRKVSHHFEESGLVRLEEENAKLKRLLALTEATEFDRQEKESKVTGHLSASDVETIRGVFDVFDTNNNGCIDIDALTKLHTKLGEPLTETEATEAMQELDSDNIGQVSFDKFLFWWYNAHRGEKKGKSKYHTKFKFISAALHSDDFDRRRVICNKSCKEGSRQFRLQFYYKQRSGELKHISPWHDIPLCDVGHGLDAKIFNFVTEIPKWTRAKYEIATGEPFNPIKQDVKNGKLRFYKHGDMCFNYGLFPRTWEDPSHIPEDTGFPGDNDPLDALELGSRQLVTGSITPVKILGLLALIDDNETDWKILCINIADPLAQKLNDIDDVEHHLPGAITAIREYLRVYKCWSGAPENTFALNEEAMPKHYAIQVVEDCHQSWKKLNASNKTTV